MSRLRSRVANGADAGTSLAELLVSMLVSSIIGTIATVSVIFTLRTSRATGARVTNLSGAQVALDAMSKLIQTAAQPPAVKGATPVTAVIAATATDFKFYGYNAPGAPPAQIEFKVVNGKLLETVTPATNSGPNACLPPYTYGASTTRTLATGVNTSHPVFTYFSQPTAANLSGAPLSLIGSPPALSAVDRGGVELVGMTLSVGQSSNPKVAPTGASITVSLPNHLVATPSLPGAAC
jgi:Tfp pilus assembly protein PilW